MSRLRRQGKCAGEERAGTRRQGVAVRGTGKGGVCPGRAAFAKAKKLWKNQRAVSFRAKRGISLWFGRIGGDKQSEIPRFARNDKRRERPMPASGRPLHLLAEFSPTPTRGNPINLGPPGRRVNQQGVEAASWGVPGFPSSPPRWLFPVADRALA